MAAFEIKNKVALITGGASGLGFQYALGLLEKGARGITLADINLQVGNQAVKEIESKYEKNKAIFVKTDVCNYEEFEGKNGTIHGMLLGLDNYLPKYKSDSEALIVNISSISGVAPSPAVPIYVGTKFAVHGMTLSWGLSAHYNRSKVRVVGVCPGVTLTPLILEVANRMLSPVYEDIRITSPDNDLPKQEPEEIVSSVMQIIEKAPSGTMWVVEGAQPPYQYETPNRFDIPKVLLK